MSYRSRVRNFLLSRRARKKASLEIPVGKRRLWFSTTSEVSKAWFYPRYINGLPHEPSVTDLFCNEVKAGEVVFDIGANQGYFTVLSGALATDGEVHAFELDPTLVPLIRDSVLLNTGLCPIFINQAAVADSVGDYITFAPHIDGNLTTNSIHHTAVASAVQVCSSTVTIDHYCERRAVLPGFVKMDVEGAEYEAIKGMMTTLARAKPRLLIEIHPVQLKEQGRNGDMVVDLIMSAVPSYRCFEVDDYREKSEDYLRPATRGSLSDSDAQVVLYFTE